MARNKADLINIDKSDLVRYPNGRIQNDTGSGNGTPVNEVTKGDIHEFFDKIMRLSGTAHNGLPDNEVNGFQFVDAIIALASKNDFVIPLTNSGSVLSIPIKIGILKSDESFVLKSSVDKVAQTQIKGSDGIIKNVTFLGGFKSGEYVRFINTPSNVILVRMVDAFNLDTVVNELYYLKKASQVQEDAGDSELVATTPKSNKTVFQKRVNGVDSSEYLAKPTGDPEVRNGLLSSVDKKRIDDFVNPADLIKVTSASNVEVTAKNNLPGNENNFNFNYVDVFPPVGKNMSNFRGMICSFAENFQDDSLNEDCFCKWRVEADKVRIIAGIMVSSSAAKVNYLAIWI